MHRIIDRDADGDRREPGRDRGKMMVPDRNHDTRDQRSEKRWQKGERRQPTSTIRRQAEHEHRGHPKKDAPGRVADDQSGVVDRHTMTTGDRHLRSWESRLDLIGQPDHLVDERPVLAGIRRRKPGLGHHENVSPVTADDPPVNHLRVTESRLQRHDLVQQQFTHPHGVSGHDVLQDHPFRPCELAPHHTQVLTDTFLLELGRKRTRILIRE